MQKLIELANSIENVELKKKVIDLIKDPKLSNPSFKKYQEILPCKFYRSFG